MSLLSKRFQRHPVKGRAVTSTPRFAMADDLPFILDIGRKFHSAAKISYPLDEDSLKQSLTNMLQHEDAGLFVCGDGAAGAVLSPAWLNYSHKIGQELFLWSPDGNGAKLLKFMEDWAVSRGAKSFAMLCMESMRPKSVGKFYERRGYTPTEHVFVKDF